MSSSSGIPSNGQHPYDMNPMVPLMTIGSDKFRMAMSTG